MVAGGMPLVQGSSDGSHKDPAVLTSRASRKISDLATIRGLGNPCRWCIYACLHERQIGAGLGCAADMRMADSDSSCRGGRRLARATNFSIAGVFQHLGLDP